MTRYTEEQLDELFNIRKVGQYLNNNYPITREHNVNIYNHIVYPLCIVGDDGLYRCVLHQPFRNKWFSSFVHHVLVTDPEKHKQYIKQRLFKGNVTESSHTATTDTTK